MPTAQQLLSRIDIYSRTTELLVYLPAFIIITLLLCSLLLPLGWLLMDSQFRQRQNQFLVLGMAGIISTSFIIVLINLLSYYVKPPVSFFVSLTPFLLALIYFVNKLRKSFIRFLMPIVKNRLFLIMFFIMFAFLFMSTFRLYNFDETLHTQVVASLLKGNFPIRQPTNYYWLRQYDYHYGWQLVAAFFSAVSSFPPSVGLDLVKYTQLVFGLLLIFGILKRFNLSDKISALATTGALLSGPFWFFQDSFTRQYIYGITEPFINFSIFHNLQAISHYSIFYFLGCSFLVFDYLKPSIINNYKFSLKIYLCLILILLAMALTAEYYLFILISFFYVFVIIKTILDVLIYKENRSHFIQFISKVLILTLLFTLAGILSVFQGGVISGLVGHKDIIDPSISKVISYFENKKIGLGDQALTNTTSIKTRPIIAIRSPDTWGFILADKVYLSIFHINNWIKILPAVGLMEPIVYPSLVLYFIYLIFIKRKPLNNLIFYFILICIGTPLIGGIFTTRYGDQGLDRSQLINQILYLGISIGFLYSQTPDQNSVIIVIKRLFITLIILSSIPTAIFILGIFIVKPDFGPFSQIPPDINQSDKLLIEKARKLPLVKVFTTTQDGMYFSESTGLFSYQTFSLFYPNIYSKIISNIDPAEIKTVGADYLWINESWRQLLSSKGKANLKKYYHPVLSVIKDNFTSQLYSLD